MNYILCRVGYNCWNYCHFIIGGGGIAYVSVLIYTLVTSPLKYLIHGPSYVYHRFTNVNVTYWFGPMENCKCRSYLCVNRETFVNFQNK